MSILKNIVRFLAWHSKFEKCKALRKESNEKLIPIAWHPKRWWNFCMSEVDKKRNRTSFYWVMLLVCIQFESINTWCSSKLLWKFSHFAITNHTWRLDIAKNCFSWQISFGINVSKYIFENIYNNLAHKNLI